MDNINITDNLENLKLYIQGMTANLEESDLLFAKNIYIMYIKHFRKKGRR